MERMGEQKEQVTPRNLLIHPEETIQAMANLEGPAWLEQQNIIEERLNEEGVTDAGAIEDIAHESVIGALYYLKHAKEIVREDDDNEGGARIVYRIYGAHGINRYYVSSDGSVRFSRSHADQEHCDRAEELGFEIAS